MQYASLLDDNTPKNKKNDKFNINKINSLLDSIHGNNLDSDSDSESDNEEVNLSKKKTKPKPMQNPNPTPTFDYTNVFKSSPYTLLNNNGHQELPPQTQPQNPIMNTNNPLIDKLNYIIHLLEEAKDEKTGNVTEEVVLYSFLGIFIIFIVDSFSKMGKYTR